MPDNAKRKIWKIAADCLCVGTVGTVPNQAGTWGEDGKGCSVYKEHKPQSQTHDGQTVCPLTDEQMPVQFRIKDDDGELYYEGIMTKACSVDAPFAPLDDFAQPNAGATSIELLGDNGRWEPV